MELHDGKKNCMRVPKWFKCFHGKDEVLLLDGVLPCLKQVAMEYCKEYLKAYKPIGDI